MPKPQPIPLKLKVSPALFARINAFRHHAMHDTRNGAMIELLAAGLAALAKPVSLPASSAKPEPPRLIGYAGETDRPAVRAKAS